MIIMIKISKTNRNETKTNETAYLGEVFEGPEFLEQGAATVPAHGGRVENEGQLLCDALVIKLDPALLVSRVLAFPLCLCGVGCGRGDGVALCLGAAFCLERILWAEIDAVDDAVDGEHLAQDARGQGRGDPREIDNAPLLLGLVEGKDLFGLERLHNLGPFGLWVGRG